MAAEEAPLHMSFAGCGFLGIYHVGVASAVKQYAPELLSRKIAGASAGAIAAAALICDCCLGQSTSDVLKVVVQARARALGPLHPHFSIVRILRDGLFAILPADAHLIASGRLFISLTRFSDGRNVVVSQYDSRQELIEALVCTSFIPFYCGAVPPAFRGIRYIDGGFSDNQPVFGEPTVTVSPFSGESDICPADADSASFLGMELNRTSIRFTARNLYRFAVALFPPHPEVMSNMCRQGFEDALRYLARTGVISCTRCVAVRSCIAYPHESEMVQPATEAAPSSSPKQLVESKSMPNLGGVRHARSLSSSASRPRLRSVYESECESCRQAPPPKLDLPALVKNPLDAAEADERTWLRYLLSLRPVKLLRYFTIPWLLPWDLTYTACVRLLEWLPSLPGDARWLIERATKTARFVIAEIETSRHLYSARFTCQLSISELNYTADERRRAQTAPRWDETEMNFGFSADLNSSSRPVRMLADVVRASEPTHSDVSASAVAHASEHIQWASLHATADGGDQTDLDTCAAVVEYTRRNDALMAYYYLDEHNQVKVTEIFGVESDCRAPLSGGFSRPASVKPTSQSADELAALPPPADSGLSTADDGAAQHTRDACCSPVHELRRHRRATTKRPTIRWALSPTSSDSEAHGSERLFVPGRPRQRVCSNDYEAGQSSTEDVDSD